MHFCLQTHDFGNPESAAERVGVRHLRPGAHSNGHCANDCVVCWEATRAEIDVREKLGYVCPGRERLAASCTGIHDTEQMAVRSRGHGARCQRSCKANRRGRRKELRRSMPASWRAAAIAKCARTLQRTAGAREPALHQLSRSG